MKGEPLSYVSLVSQVLPVGAGLWKRSSLVGELRIFYGYVVANVVIEFASYWMAMHNIHNLWLSHTFVLLEYCLLALVFAGWQRSSRMRTILRWSIPVYAAFWLVAVSTFEKFAGPDQYTSTVSGVVMIMLAAWTLVGLMKEEEVLFHLDPRFWIAVGVLLDDAGTIMLSIFNGPILQMRIEEFLPFWKIHWGLSIATNLCFMGGLLCPKRP